MWTVTFDFPIGVYGIAVRIAPQASSALFLVDATGDYELVGELQDDYTRSTAVLRWDELALLARALPEPRWAIELLLLRYVALAPEIAND